MTGAVRQELVLLLLKHGASVSVVNGDGRLAAAVSSDPYISSLLRAAAGTERRLRQQRLLRAASDGLTTTVDRMVRERAYRGPHGEMKDIPWMAW